jgi:hypothetical protein
MIRDPDLVLLLIPNPGPRGQKGTGSRIRNTDVIIIPFLLLVVATDPVEQH